VNAVNYRGVWACMKHELRQMREQGSGAIVNCSSIGGRNSWTAPIPL
jgi:NADP-dependent 3-hydroxy acid dehydrogenase YdfG